MSCYRDLLLTQGLALFCRRARCRAGQLAHPLVVIVHRLFFLENGFLENGRLDATGTYDDLLETRGSFRQMAAV